MKKLLRNLSRGLALFFLPAGLPALTPSAWQYRQSLTVDRAGPLKIPLPAETLDHARPDLSDLRVLGPQGQELPCLLSRPPLVPEPICAPKTFDVTLRGAATVVTLETGTSDPLSAVALRTGARSFLKPARIESSPDGRQWETLSEGVPFFRQDGAEQTVLPLGRRRAAFLRLTLGDERTEPVAVTGAMLFLAGAAPPPAEPLHPRTVSSENFGRETVVTLDLGAANLALESLHFTCADPLFSRSVTVAVRELHGDELSERILARGTIYRVALEGLVPAAQGDLLVNATVPSRELIVHIENGDSPPLNISGIAAERQPVYLIFAPPAPGNYELRVGNAQAPTPAYDLAPLGASLDRLPVAAIQPGPPVPDPQYQPSQPLADLLISGGPLDPAPWTRRKPVMFSAPGVQQLELDLDVLAGARPDFADLRLLGEDRQIPYVLERTAMSRALPLTAVPDSEAKRTSFSHWKIVLPRAGLPLSRLVLTSPTPLFQRHLRVYETISDERGDTYEHALADADWVRLPGDPVRTLSIGFETRPQTGLLQLETDNADNPPIVIDQAQGFYPVTRLLFKVSSDQTVALLYGNAGAAPPRYDLGLVAGQLLKAEKNAASLGREETVSASPGVIFFQGMRTSVIFWGALTVVIILLLVIVAKLLPKPPPEKPGA